MERQYRNLTADQISQLEAVGCQCADWSRIHVGEGFSVKSVRNVHFSGDVRLGIYEKPISFVAGFEGSSGIYNSSIHNCCIGDNVYISNVHTLANYNVSDDCILTNITYLAVQGKTTFGNGTETKVIIEAGGREIKIYDKLTSQTGYIIANYRHHKNLIERLNSMIDDYCRSIESQTGHIGAGTKIMNCGTLKNIKVGPNAVLEGVNRLENGSINSTCPAHVRIGANVIAKDFIIQSGTKILDNVILDKVFVGQGCELGKGYSAENSVFFANCGGFHGEACSVFAGPFTVTHHKATLLIAGMFSFFNAGSSSNQSNHMYKLGSYHQAIFERGCKMGSGTHVVYPARFGAFNVILGKHDSHPDTRDLPFSYILQSEGKTLIVPGYNLLSSGTLRDMNKWPARDERKDSEKFDLITFDGINPYTVSKMFNGIEILRSVEAKFGNNADWMRYDNMTMKAGWSSNGIEYYQMAIDDYLGSKLAERLDQGKDINGGLDGGIGDWVDVGGLIAPNNEVQRLCDEIENGSINDIFQIRRGFEEIYHNYSEYEWAWVSDKIRNMAHGDVLRRWKDAFEKLADLILKDANKEFSETASIPFGIDGDQSIKQADFAAARGTLDENSFVKKLKTDLEAKRKLAEKLGID